MVLKRNLSATAAITLDFTISKRIHNCPRADGFKKTCPLQQQLPSTSQSPNEFTIVQERMVFKKNLPATAAITLDFTIPQRIHNCPRADGIKKKLARYSSNYPQLHNPPTSSQLSKSGWYLQKQMPSTAAITLDFTIPQRIHNCPKADGIKKNWPSTAAMTLDFTIRLS